LESADVGIARPTRAAALDPNKDDLEQAAARHLGAMVILADGHQVHDARVTPGRQGR